MASHFARPTSRRMTGSGQELAIAAGSCLGELANFLVPDLNPDGADDGTI